MSTPTTVSRRIPGRDARWTPALRGATAAVVGLACAVALAACGGADDGAPAEPSEGTSAPSVPGSPSEPGNTPSDANSSTPPADEPPGDESVDALIKAGDTALAEVDGGTLISIEEERGEWEIEIADGTGDEYDVMVSADGAEITRGPDHDRQDAEDREENTHMMSAAEIDYSEAAKAAAEEVPGATITELNLDTTGKHRTVVWECDLRDSEDNKHELDIDAQDASILEHDVND